MPSDQLTTNVPFSVPAERNIHKTYNGMAGLPSYMSCGQYFWQAKMTWILYKDTIRAHNRMRMQNPVSTLDMALLSIILTVAHMIEG